MGSISVAPGPEPAWRQARRAHLLSTTLALFRSQALEDVSTDDIARAAGVGKATLYRYFETKEALVRACLDEVVARLNERLEAAEAGPAPPPERLRRIVGAMVDTFSDDLMPLRLITRRERDLREEWRLSVHDARLRLVAVLGEHFRSGTAAGWYRQLDGELIAHFVMGMIRSGVTHVEGISRAALGDAIHDFVLRAAATDPAPAARLPSMPGIPPVRDRLSGGADVDR